MTTTHENLTRVEAEGRAQLIQDLTYRVELDLTAGSRTFVSRTEIRFACTEPGASTFVDLTAATVESINLNGRLLPETARQATRIDLDDLGAENVLIVESTMQYQHEGKGLHRFQDPTDLRVYLHTQFEPFDAHLVYACFDQPDLKATFDFSVKAPAKWVVVSNEAMTERPPEGAAGTWTFATTPLLSPYVTAVVAGEYTSVHDRHGDVALGLYLRHSLLQHLDQEDIFLLTKQGLDWYDANFGITYPFTKYDQLFVPEFSAGAMENPGCVTFSESYIFRSKVTDAQYERRAETILHEMAHMWFGDLVTMRWWDDLWLNESFATFCSVLSMVEATRFTNGWVTFLDAFKTWAKFQDELPTTHPVAAELPDVESVHQNFDGITYAKGASLLRQLVAWVGQDAFLEGCRQYFKAHQWGNATEDDFLAALRAASDRDVQGWRDSWLTTTGVNTLQPVYDIAEDGTFASFDILQTAHPQHPSLRPHRLSIGVYDLVEDRYIRTHRVEVDIDGARSPVPELVGIDAGALVLVNDDDLTFAKASIDDRSMSRLTDGSASLSDPLPRALVWGSSWDMLRDGALPATRYVDLVLANIAHETDVGVTQRLTVRATAAAERYAAPAHRDALLERLAVHARERLAEAEPGSDEQLVWAHQFANTARSDTGLGEVNALLTGAWSIDGLDIDTELRWHLLTALARAGRVGSSEISAEFDRDPTDIGERHGLTALASRPEAVAKAEAWKRLTEDTELSHTLSRHLFLGFQQMTQAELLEPWVDRYFEVLDDVWSERSLDWAIEFSSEMFPHPAASEELLERTERLTRRDDLQGPLRRVLLKQKDILERTIRARKLDAGA